MKLRFSISLLTSFFILISCSSTQEAYINNVNIFMDVKDGIHLTDEEIAASKADLIYIISGKRPQATMALAFIEDGQYKWVSRNNVVFVMQQGRLKRTTGLDHDLLYVGNLQNDPLKDGAKLSNGAKWERYVDAQNDYYGVKLESEFDVTEEATISIRNKNFRTIKITEFVVFESQAHADDSWVNTFWYDKNSGQLLKSIQKNASDADVYDITYVSRALRLSTQ